MTTRAEAIEAAGQAFADVLAKLRRDGVVLTAPESQSAAGQPAEPDAVTASSRPRTAKRAA
jgi:hypothetical protein